MNTHLKLNTKKFNGVLNNVPYRVTYELNENNVTLYLKTTIFGEENVVGACVETHEGGEENQKQAIVKVLKRASERWEMQLTKLKLVR